MKLSKLLIAVFAAALSLSACGGGSSASTAAVTVASPAALTLTDTVVGTGATVAVGSVITVTYTGWLYVTTSADFKGAQFDTGTFSFTVGSGTVIPGFDTGVVGMKVGGTRTMLIPSSLGYGTTGTSTIPANSGLVFQVAVTAVQ